MANFDSTNNFIANKNILIGIKEMLISIDWNELARIGIVMANFDSTNNFIANKNILIGI
ncbi:MULTISPECIES: hypothetical protein [unclassified Acinetobacter]|nr:hypothetical protein [Acinetobacter sp. ANC 4218]